MIKKIESFSLYCDHCGEELVTHHDGFSIFVDESQAHENADNEGWESNDGIYYCPECHFFDDEDVLHLRPERKKEAVSLQATPSPKDQPEGQNTLRWVKASERLPEKEGVDNLLPCKIHGEYLWGYKHMVAGYGYKMYLLSTTGIGYRYLTLDCEWLEEEETSSRAIQPDLLSEMREKAIRDGFDDLCLKHGPYKGECIECAREETRQMASEAGMSQEEGAKGHPDIPDADMAKIYKVAETWNEEIYPHFLKGMIDGYRLAMGKLPRIRYEEPGFCEIHQRPYWGTCLACHPGLCVDKTSESALQGQIPEEIMEWIKEKCFEVFPYVYDDDAHCMGIDAKRHAGTKIAMLLHHKLQEEIRAYRKELEYIAGAFPPSSHAVIRIKELLAKHPHGKEEGK